MALMQRYLRSQFIGSTLGRPVLIAGIIDIDPPVNASLNLQQVIFTANVTGSSGNSITIAITAGATAGAEVVTVVGNAISIQIDSGVSTVTQVRTAVNASVAAAALITASGTSTDPVSAPVAPTPLAGGYDGQTSFSMGQLVSSVTRTGIGEYTVTLADKYHSAQFIQFQFGGGPQNIVAQVKSQSVSSTKTIVVTLLSGATPTEISGGGILLFKAILNISSIYY